MFGKGRVQWHAVDVVALVLAMGLTISLCLILVVTGIQVVKGGSFPKVELSENATQILIAGMGGLTGLLGAYIGVNRQRKPPEPPKE
jgi:hypothetical protein